MRCPNCGAEMSDGYARCPNCGTVLQMPLEQSPAYYPPDNGHQDGGAYYQPIHNKSNKKIMLAIAIVAVVLISAVAAFLLMGGGGGEREMSYKEFIEQYDHDGDGRPESTTPKDFKEGDRVLIRDFAVDLRYDASYDVTLIQCKSMENYGYTENNVSAGAMAMVAKGDLSRYKGKEFTYEYVFKKYTMNGETFIMPEELWLQVSYVSTSTEITQPIMFVVNKMGATNWTLDIAANDLDPHDLMYSLQKYDGSYLAVAVPFPTESGSMDANGVIWYDLNGDNLVNTGDTITINNGEVDSGDSFIIRGGAEGSVTLP